MLKNFWHLIWLSFLKVQGVVSVIGAIILAFILWYIKPNGLISIGIILPIMIICLIIVITLVNAAYISFKASRHPLPKVIVSRKPPTNFQDARALCLLEPSELFSYNMFVSFYFIDSDNFERLIGIGEVVNIQKDSKIQVILGYAVEGYDSIITSLTRNDSSIVKKIFVRPNAPINYLNIYFNRRRSGE